MRIAVQQRLALAAATLVLAASAAGFATDAGENDEEVVSLPTPGATASVAPTPATTATAGATPGPARTTAAATRAPVAATPAATADPRIAKAPKPGRYAYTIREDGEDRESVLEVSDRGSGRQTENFDGVRTEVVWTTAGKFLESSDFGFTCDWEPDLRELKLPLAEGSQWTLRGDCEPAAGVTLEATGSAEVREFGRSTVGGATVDTWHIVTELVVTGTTPDEMFEQRGNSDVQFAPAYGLYVRSVAKVDGTDPATGRPEKSTATRELRNLTPG